MSASIDGTAIDKVLRDAVESGGVPHVAAIAADRDGVIYQGAAGLREAGQSDPVTVDTLFRIMSMTKLPCTVAALQQVEQGNLDLDARRGLLSGVRPGAGADRLRRGYPEAAASGPAGHREEPDHAHHRPGLLVL
jgi:Beta-lactamase